MRGRKTIYRGELYDSAAESHRAATLDLLTRAGKLARWERGASQVILDDGVGRSVSYCPDFIVYMNDGTRRAEEVKGYARDKKKRLVLPRDLRMRMILWEQKFVNLPVIVVDKDGTELWKLPPRKARKVKAA